MDRHEIQIQTSSLRRASLASHWHCGTLWSSRCGYHLPGWKTMVSTKDARTRQQREADRKVRQIEKLPPVEALHDFQYPYEKTVLSDYMFQYPLYENELDTPHLFHVTPPPDFFLYWNVSDFNRTAYPEVPEEDHRFLTPSASSPPWRNHRLRALRYLEKHEITPRYIPQVRFDANLSVVFPGQYATRAQREARPRPVRQRNRRNFWFTAHCGNYIELTDVQEPPSVFIEEPRSGVPPSPYTLLVVSPDYPYRIPLEEDKNPDRGFFLHYMVANLKPGADGHPWSGDVVVPYVAPLPTEEAGTTRHVCVLYRQSEAVPLSVTPDEEWERQHFDLRLRSNYRLHERRCADGPLHDISAVERLVEPEPAAVTFFLTSWDIQVQEYYQRIGHPEPAAPADDRLEALLEFHAMDPASLRVRTRHRADGSTNIGDDHRFWGAREPTHVMDGSMQTLWSRRTAMGSNGVPVTYQR